MCMTVNMHVHEITIYTINNTSQRKQAPQICGAYAYEVSKGASSKSHVGDDGGVDCETVSAAVWYTCSFSLSALQTTAKSTGFAWTS